MYRSKGYSSSVDTVVRCADLTLLPGFYDAQRLDNNNKDYYGHILYLHMDKLCP